MVIMTKTKKRKIILSWLWVVLCSLGIFAIVPLARTIQEFVAEKWGKEFFGYLVFLVLGAGILALLYFLIFKFKIKSPANYIWLGGIGAVYTYFTLKLWEVPVEAVHFLEYGLLGFFLFKALRHHVGDKSIYITAALLALFVGTFDEILQWVTPERMWDFRDVGLNGLSGGLFQVAVWKVVRPKDISPKIKPRSWRVVSVVLGGCLLLLGLCASNTPQRVAEYTRWFPALSFLQKEEPMSEFGYKYKDPQMGIIFYSRLSLKKIHKMDKKYGKNYGDILNKASKMRYQKFLNIYNPGANPFLHEVRVHIFRRNRYFHRAKKVSNPQRKERFYFVAYKENLLLEKYYRKTLKNSPYWWDKRKKMRLSSRLSSRLKRNTEAGEKYSSKQKFREEESEKQTKTEREENKIKKKVEFYKTPVSSNLFTAFTEGEMWIVILSVLIFLFMGNWILGKS